MYTPFEVIVKSILPAIRSILVRELSHTYGYKQTDIARALYITQASVSYYMSQSRGKYIDEIYKYPDVLNKIKKLAEKIVRDKPPKEEVMKDLNEIVIYFITREYICDFHKVLEPNVDVDECKVCEAIISRRFT